MIKPCALFATIILLSTSSYAIAQKGPSVSQPPADPAFGVTLDSFEEGGENLITLDGIRARIEVRANPQDTTTPIYIIEDDDGELLRFEGTENFMSFLPVTLRMAQLDPTSPEPEVIASTYTGGAHCCELLQVAAVQPDGQWTMQELGAFDGGYTLVDPDGDGTPEIQVADQSFLYTFDCYACSWPPPQFFAVRDGAISDVSADPAMQPAFAAEMHGRSLGPEQQLEPGFLAGWAAIRARLGEGEAALSEIEQGGWAGSYTYDVCTTGGSPFDCPADNVRQQSFAAFLRAHLADHGYIRQSDAPARKG